MFQTFTSRSSHTYCGATADSIECDSSEYAAKYLKNKCNGKKKCLIKADSNTLEDGKHPSCTGISKYLLVNYVCNPKLKSKVLLVYICILIYMCTCMYVEI